MKPSPCTCRPLQPPGRGALSLHLDLVMRMLIQGSRKLWALMVHFTHTCGQKKGNSCTTAGINQAKQKQEPEESGRCARLAMDGPLENQKCKALTSRQSVQLGRGHCLRVITMSLKFDNAAAAEGSGTKLVMWIWQLLRRLHPTH